MRPLFLIQLFVAAAGASILSPAAAQVTMSDLWPNEDGQGWGYAQSYHDLLQGEVVENQARLYFDGHATVPGGILVQNLREESDMASVSRRALDRGSPGMASPPDEVAVDPLLRCLWVARPDLRGRIEAKAGVPAGGSERIGGAGQPLRPMWYQILIQESAYRKTDIDIGAYRRDIEATQSWLWLVADLTIGNTFDLQLVPDLADDVWLYGTIAAWEDVVVPAGLFTGCLRVDYRIDYGEGICTNEQGQETGGFTSETRGFIHYAPDVGPVNHYEEFIPVKEMLWGECEGLDEHIGEVVTYGSLQLLEDQPTAVRRTSWGQIRSGFRARVPDAPAR